MAAPPAPYASMAPIAQYLMDRDAEIALARSAAPPSISADAGVLVLTAHGYETAVKGTNGFVCMVERSWLAALDAPEFWNPRIRGADCFNPPAARSVIPLHEMRTELLLSGHSRAQVLAQMRTALDTGALPQLEPGAMSFMMAKGSYLTDKGHHNLPHVMFFEPQDDPAAFGADLPGSPILSGSYWLGMGKSDLHADGIPPLRILVVPVSHWSDGSKPDDAHRH